VLHSDCWNGTVTVNCYRRGGGHRVVQNIYGGMAVIDPSLHVDSEMCF